MNTTRLIEAYLDGTLEQDQAEELKIRIKSDFEFAELVRLHKEINESIRDNELHSLRLTLRRITDWNGVLDTGVKYPLRRIIQIAAIFLFILIFGTALVKWLFPEYSGSAIFEKFYTRYEPDVITRSGNLSGNDMQDAKFLYETGNFAECAIILNEMVNSNEKNYMALFYLGLTNIELHRPNDAIRDFLRIPPDWNSPYSLHRNWYLALCLILNGQEKLAKPILKRLSSGNDFYSDKAMRILEMIRI